MAELHPAASHNLPSFIAVPGETDVLMLVMGAILVLTTMAFGVLYFRLHCCLSTSHISPKKYSSRSWPF
jgi:hypothetical protein